MVIFVFEHFDLVHPVHRRTISGADAATEARDAMITCA